MNIMNKGISELIHKLTELSERQLEQETAARFLLEETLVQHGVEFFAQEYNTHIPYFKDWDLEVDGEKIDSLPSGLISGEITSKSAILSSLISSQHNLYDANINFNPECEVVSRSNFYFAPALAIQRSDVQRVVMAKKIKGHVSVEKTAHQTANLLVGNRTNPKVIVFSHYDSISTGAVDNASGTALMLDLVLHNRELLSEVLFAFCGNEELSYDEPVYWGHGYREFEAVYDQQLVSANKILVVDSFGHSEPEAITDVSLMKLAFPIVGIQVHAHKTVVLAGDIQKLMPFYHARNDTPDNIKKEYYDQTHAVAMRLIAETCA